jgi:5-methylcytosine-specific restriction enzyme A
MAKLGRLPQRLGSARSVAAQRGVRQVEPVLVMEQRGAGPAYRQWYKLARWVKLRAKVLLRDCYTCAMCGMIGQPTVKRGRDEVQRLVADHIEMHRGDERLFWDEDNLQTLCVLCHASEKQRREALGLA